MNSNGGKKKITRVIEKVHKLFTDNRHLQEIKTTKCRSSFEKVEEQV